MKQSHEEKQEQIINSHKVLHVIEYFPGFEGYNGNGPGRILERLASTHKHLYPNEYSPHVYVANKKNENNYREYPFPIIEDPKKTALGRIVQKHNVANTILHFANSEFAERFPESFIKIGKVWTGPIIQRVTLTSRIALIQEHLQEEFHTYFSMIDVFISQSKQMTRELLELSIPKDRIVQIENGVDCKSKRPKTQKQKEVLRKNLIPDICSRDIVFLYAARLLDPTKRVNELVRTWIEGGFGDKGCSLILAGNYLDVRTETQSAVSECFKKYSTKELFDHHIFLTGQLVEEELENYFAIADVYVSPSAQEGFSNSMLEAMAWGVPVIGRHGVSGHEELIIPKKTGLVFDTTTQLGDCILRLASEHSLRKAMGRSARVHIVENYSIEQMVEKYRKLYASLLTQEATAE